MIEQPIQAQMLTDGDRVVIYDAARLPAPQPGWFTPEHWPQRSVLDRGRGATFALHADFGDAVLRRYRRGGAVARCSGQLCVDRCRPSRDRCASSGCSRPQSRPVCRFRGRWRRKSGVAAPSIQAIC
ncbi:MAG: hypothetical protein IPO66_14245 [Rhodanobacteraceae bacterium]|nr:hypothetical protein [Rhodanobacteraceae bacterium]